MQNKSYLIRKVPERSVMSDEELATLIRKQREKYPEEFETIECVSDSEPAPYKCSSSVNNVISKWL